MKRSLKKKNSLIRKTRKIKKHVKKINIHIDWDSKDNGYSSLNNNRVLRFMMNSIKKGYNLIQTQPKKQTIYTFISGMDTLPNRLVDKIGSDSIITNHKITNINVNSSSEWIIDDEFFSDVIITIPSHNLISGCLKNLRFIEEKQDRIKKTRIKINYPKEGYKTTVEPLAGDDVIVPYRPMISKLQNKYTKYYKKTKKKKTYKVTNNNVV